MRRKFMSMALTAAMVLSMAATPVFAEDTASDEGFNLNLCIASEPQTIDPALNSAVDGAIMCNHMFEGLAIVLYWGCHYHLSKDGLPPTHRS